MKIKAGKKLWDSRVEPLMIIFESEEEKIFHIKQLLDMNGREGQLGYTTYPSEYSQKKLMKFLNTSGISVKPLTKVE